MEDIDAGLKSARLACLDRADAAEAEARSAGDQANYFANPRSRQSALADAAAWREAAAVCDSGSYPCFVNSPNPAHDLGPGFRALRAACSSVQRIQLITPPPAVAPD